MISHLHIAYVKAPLHTCCMDTTYSNAVVDTTKSKRLDF